MLLALAPACAHERRANSAYNVEVIDRIWSGHSVQFALAATETTIFVAYYDAARQMTVASRARDGAIWTYQKLASTTGWDSHNYIAIAIDSAGQLHLAGNMHNDPLLYYRSETPGDVASLRRIGVMAERAVEQRMTYPVFLRDAVGRLIFKYRDGGSGAGNEIYNIYDTTTQSWRPLLATPLVDGEGERNAYFVGPVLGPNGYFHLPWVWRETPDAATNHDLSYARSRDLVRWERSDGAPLPLPIRLSNAEIVDAVPAGGGMINNNTVMGFDAAGRPMITFHKFDALGYTQVFVARRETDGWIVRQASNWSNFRWSFGGGGSLDFRLSVQGAVPIGADRLRISVVRDGAPIDLLLDAETLALIDERPGETLAHRLRDHVVTPADMQLNTVEEQSGLALAWATRPPNRDLPRDDIPPPSPLYLVTSR